MMSSFIKEYKLNQQTPLIHFQYNELGATLRATEVKPKLDRFISEKVHIPEEWILKSGDENDSGKSSALNYKMKIVSNDVETVDLGFKTDYDIFYGNMGDNIKKGVMCKDITLTIICKIPKLMETIDENISEFLIVENFGTMQSKGFGSFTVDGAKLDSNSIANALKNRYGSRTCYKFKSGDTPFNRKTAFKRIKTFYGIMKSGVNFGGYQKSLLFIYLSDKKIDNEKSYLKQSEMAPRLTKKGLDSSPVSLNPNSNYHYVRALLGVGDHIDFKNDNGQSDEQKNDKTEIKFINNEIKRLNSPIFFKIVGDDVYMVAKRINSKIYEKSFDFTAEPKRDKKAPKIRNFTPKKTSAVLTVPKESDIGSEFIDDFLDFCVGCFNGEIKHPKVGNDILHFRDIKGIRISEVK